MGCPAGRIHAGLLADSIIRTPDDREPQEFDPSGLRVAHRQLRERIEEANAEIYFAAQNQPQFAGMGKSLAETFPSARTAFEEADDALGFPISRLCFEGPEEALKLTENTQPALLERAHLAITREQPAQSATLLAQAEDEAVWARERRQLLIAHETQYLRLAQLRWQLVFADAAQLKPVQQALKEEMALARANGRQRRLWVLQTWQAVAHERLGQWRDAQALLLNVLAQLAPEGYMRLLLDEGPMVARLLRRLQREAARELAAAPAVAAFADALVAALGPLGTLGDAELLEPATPCAVLSGEPLTQRERQVLQLLVDGYSNSAMAEKLFLSDSTVRTHLRSINAKLGARSRTHALALARKAGLL